MLTNMFFTQKMPSKFTKRYGAALSNPMLLKPPDGTEWKMFWTKENGDVWFKKGWKEFAENYSLDEGYLVVFEYEGTSKFGIHILGQNGSEIDYPSCDIVDDENENLDQSDDESVQFLGEAWPELPPPQPHKKMRGTNVF